MHTVTNNVISSIKFLIEDGMNKLSMCLKKKSSKNLIKKQYILMQVKLTVCDYDMSHILVP